jgi:hypothetical protein
MGRKWDGQTRVGFAEETWLVFLGAPTIDIGSAAWAYMVEFGPMFRAHKSRWDGWNGSFAKENLSELGFLFVLIVAFVVVLSLLGPLALFPASILKSPPSDPPAFQAGPSPGPCMTSSLRLNEVHPVSAQLYFSNHNVLDNRDSIA